MRLRDRRDSEKPREKLAVKGAEALSDVELLMALIGSGNAQADVTAIARNVLKLLKAQGASIGYEQLRAVTGLGSAKISQILSALELTKRYVLVADRPIIDSPQKAAELFADIRTKQQEYFVCITLDGANRLIAKRVVSIGTLTNALVHPREVFADAVADRAAAIIVGHNHPSGSLTASQADKAITDKLRESGTLLGIELIDHLLVSKDQTISIL